MANLTHIFKVGQKVKVRGGDAIDGYRWNKGTIKETHEDYIIIDIPEISDHCYFEEGFNLSDVYPEYNF